MQTGIFIHKTMWIVFRKTAICLQDQTWRCKTYRYYINRDGQLQDKRSLRKIAVEMQIEVTCCRDGTSLKRAIETAVLIGG